MEKRAKDISTILSVVAIVVAIIAIVLSIISISKGGASNDFALDNAQPETNVSEISGVVAGDHVRGNPNAEISIIEFSDLQCPFCSMVHPTIQQILDKYGDQVNWIYRHLPLDSIHPEAMPAAVASECVAKLGGNDAFWKFVDKTFANQDGMGSAFYKSTAKELGINASAFDTCISSAEAQELVAQDIDEAIRANIMGTPFSVIVNGKKLTPISGAQPIEGFESVITEALK